MIEHRSTGFEQSGPPVILVALQIVSRLREID